MNASAVPFKARWWQIGLFGLLVCFLLLLFSGLGRDVTRIPSPLISKSAPAFTLPVLDGDETISLDEFRGRIVIMNFWASWCGSCRAEHGVLLDVARQFENSDEVAFLGINYKDTPARARKFLSEYGAFPYRSGVDGSGRIGLQYGVYGLPETYVIDRTGTIVDKQIGPLTKSVLLEKIRLSENGK